MWTKVGGHVRPMKSFFFVDFQLNFNSHFIYIFRLQTNKINSKDLLIHAAGYTKITDPIDQWDVFIQKIAFKTLVDLNEEL